MAGKQQTFPFSATVTARRFFAALAGIMLSVLAIVSTAQAIPRGDARIAVDAQTGEVLTAVGSQVRWHPASLTKMMTLYQLFDALERGKVSMSTRIKLSRRASRQPPSKLGLGHGGVIRVRDAIPALAIKSANDVAAAVAEHLGKSEANFAKRMTQTARRLGMRRTNFRNASGLHHSQQFTTARDMAILSVALIRDFPQYYRYFGQATFRFGKRVYRNHNAMLKSYSGMDGMKTGYIYKSGYNLAASVQRGKRRVVAVVMGGDTSKQRNRLMKAALDLAFDRIDSPKRKRITAPLPVRLKPPPPIPSPRPYRPDTKPILSASLQQAPIASFVPVPRIAPRRQVTSTASLVASIASDPSTVPRQIVNRKSQMLSVVPVARPAPSPRFVPVSKGPSVVTPRLRPAAARRTSHTANPVGINTFGVQIGAFRSKGEASKRLAKVVGDLPNRLGEPHPVVAQHTDDAHGTYFRARLVGFDSRAAAANTCRWLKDHSTDCIIVASAR